MLKHNVLDEIQEYLKPRDIELEPNAVCVKVKKNIFGVFNKVKSIIELPFYERGDKHKIIFKRIRPEGIIVEKQSINQSCEKLVIFFKHLTSHDAKLLELYFSQTHRVKVRTWTIE